MSDTLRPVAIVSGVPEELAALRAALAGAEEIRLGARRAWRGRLAGRDAVLAVAGDGGTRAARHLDDLLSAVPCAALIGVGVAGGLSADLDVGDLVVATSVLDDERRLPAPDAEWSAAAAAAGAKPATILSTDAIAGNAIEKARLRETTGDGTAVVDLESAAWARAAAARAIPYAILRVVSDAWDEDLPEFLVRCQRDDGSVARGRVAVAAIAVPSRIPALLRLAGRVRRASTRLAEAAAAMMPAASSNGTVGRAREAS